MIPYSWGFSVCPLSSEFPWAHSISFAMEASHHKSPRVPSRSHSPSMSPNKNGSGDTDSPPLQPTAARSKSPLPWFTESYFSCEPATAAARKTYITILASKGLLIIVFLFSVLSIYWGSLWQTPAHTHNLNNWVVVSPNLAEFFSGCATLFITIIFGWPRLRPVLL